jgi:hypothetical protein
MDESDEDRSTVSITFISFVINSSNKRMQNSIVSKSLSTNECAAVNTSIAGNSNTSTTNDETTNNIYPPLTLSQIAAVEKCETTHAEKKRKVAKVTPVKKSVVDSNLCCFCKMVNCHEVKFGRYCVSKVFQFCSNKDNASMLDWYGAEHIYKDAYKEI